MIFAEPSLAEIRHVCRNMRPSSRAEMFLTRPNEDPDALADALLPFRGFMWTAYFAEHPACIIGAYPLHPGVWGLYGFGTPAYAMVIREVTKHARRFMMPAIVNAGAHRGQCISPVGHEETHRWLRFLGAKEEARLHQFGKGGEDCILFAWTKER